MVGTVLSSIVPLECWKELCSNEEKAQHLDVDEFIYVRVLNDQRNRVTIHYCDCWFFVQQHPIVGILCNTKADVKTLAYEDRLSANACMPYRDDLADATSRI